MMELLWDAKTIFAMWYKIIALRNRIKIIWILTFKDKHLVDVPEVTCLIREYPNGRTAMKLVLRLIIPNRGVEADTNNSKGLFLKVSVHMIRRVERWKGLAWQLWWMWHTLLLKQVAARLIFFIYMMFCLFLPSLVVNPY